MNWVDVGCGFLATLRSSSLAMVGLYRHYPEQSASTQKNVSRSYGINFTIDGRWVCEYDSTRYDLAGGSVTVATPGEQYACRHFDVEPNTNYLVQLAPNAIDADALPLFNKRAMRIDELGSFIARAAAHEEDEDFESTVFEIFGVVSRASYGGTRRGCIGSLRVQRIKRFIERHYCEPITLTAVARSAGINPYTCVRTFKAVSGEAPLAYILRYRIERAKDQLKLNTLSIGDIGKGVGFQSHSYFCRAFKRITGMSPGHFRRFAQGA